MRNITINKLLDFLDKSVTTFHAVYEIEQLLMSNGFIRLYEDEVWNLKTGKSYYVVRNQSSIIAWKMGSTMDINDYHFQLSATHSDSPTYKLKENGVIDTSKYIKLNVEGYGGMIASSWMDRMLSIAGRVVLRRDTYLETRLVNIDKDLLIIPNVAIHLNREVNKGVALNPQVDMQPLLGMSQTITNVNELLSTFLDESSDDILSSELFLYPRDRARVWGCNDEFIASARIDNLESTFATLTGFLEAQPQTFISVFSCFDNEEVGSSTKQGADSTFLADTLHRINACLTNKQEDYYRALAKSFMLSCDNAHALHPNHNELYDINHAPILNQGIVLKLNANQAYTTDAISSAIFKNICNTIDVPLQVYANRSDIRGGSTLGNISSTNVSINSVDIGLPQLAMHSAYECAGTQDVIDLIQLSKYYFTNPIFPIK